MGNLNGFDMDFWCTSYFDQLWAWCPQKSLSHPDWAPNTSDGWPPAVESTSTTLPEKKRWPTLSTGMRRRRKTMLVLFLMGNKKPQLYRPQKRGYFQVLALRYISISFIFSLFPHMLPSFGATCCCISLNQIMSWLSWSYNQVWESCQWNYYEHKNRKAM